MSTSPVHPTFSREALLARVATAMHPPIADLGITGWRSSEPVPFARRTSGERCELRPGDRWAERLFECAWFRFQGTIPAGEEWPVAVRIDVNGELCLVDERGTPVRGLTCVNSIFDRALGTPAKTVYRLPAALAGGGEFELWGDAGFNDLFGAAPGEGRIGFAQLCRCRDDVRALYYDLEVVAELGQLTPADDPRGAAIAAALQQVDAILDQYAAAEITAARALLAPFLAPAPSPSRLHVSALGHAHLDLAWLWPIRETIRKGARTFATALYNLRQYPEYIYGVSQPQLFAWMKEHHPDLYAQIQAAVATGAIELLGSMWVEPDCNLPSGESLVRQILHGGRYIRAEFGYEPRFCWQPDVFGYNAQLPQILKKTGHDFFMTQKLSWNLVNKFPHHSFVWEALDGSSVLAHMLPEETYNGPAAPRSLDKIAKNYAQKDVSEHALMVYGIGDGGGGPDAEHLERLRRERSLPGLPAVTPRRAAEFFAEWSRQSASFPRLKGELYLERHQGTFTTQARIKRYNRQAEMLLREIEVLAVLCARHGSAPDVQRRLDEIWKEVLLYQFHDILPGSSIKRVYDEALERYRTLLGELEGFLQLFAKRLAEQIDAASDWIAFNTQSWPRVNWLKIDGCWRQVRVPGVGWTVLAGADGGALNLSVSATEQRLENEHLRVEFSDAGLITSLVEKATGREFITPGESANAYVVYLDKGDAWDFPPDYRAHPPRRPTLVSRTAFRDGPRGGIVQHWRIGESSLQQQISLEAGSPRIEFQTTVEWHESEAMLRVCFPVAVNSTTARFEVPFGSVERSTLETNSWEKAQVEVPAQQWVDLSEPTHGVAVLNDCKYGFRIKGSVIEMNLIRSVPHPGTPLINKDDRSAAARATHFTDQGSHEFRYAVWPRSGRATEGQLTRAAREFNTPLLVLRRESMDRGSLPRTASALTIDSEAIELAALKPAENGDGHVLRLVNVEPNPVRVSIRPAVPPVRVAAADLCERNEQPLAANPDGSFELPFTPFEVKTIRLR